MTLDELERQLPNGFHDGYLLAVHLDYLAGRATFELTVDMTDWDVDAAESVQRRCQVTVGKLVYCCIQPPPPVAEILKEGFQPEGMWTDGEEMTEPSALAAGLPPTPAGCFVHRFWLDDQNSSMYVCGRDASMVWLEPAAS